MSFKSYVDSDKVTLRSMVERVQVFSDGGVKQNGDKVNPSSVEGILIFNEMGTPDAEAKPSMIKSYVDQPRATKAVNTFVGANGYGKGAFLFTGPFNIEGE